MERKGVCEKIKIVSSRGRAKFQLLLDRSRNYSRKLAITSANYVLQYHCWYLDKCFRFIKVSFSVFLSYNQKTTFNDPQH